MTVNLPRIIMNLLFFNDDDYYSHKAGLRQFFLMTARGNNLKRLRTELVTKPADAGGFLEDGRARCTHTIAWFFGMGGRNENFGKVGKNGKIWN